MDAGHPSHASSSNTKGTLSLLFTERALTSITPAIAVHADEETPLWATAFSFAFPSSEYTCKKKLINHYVRA